MKVATGFQIQSTVSLERGLGQSLKFGFEKRRPLGGGEVSFRVLLQVPELMPEPLLIAEGD